MSCKLNKINTCQSKSSGGHEGALLSTINGTCAKKTNKTELEFYRDIYKIHSPLTNHIPLYKGICKLNNINRLVVENLKLNMKNPIEIDIKIGKYTAYLSELLNSGYKTSNAIIKTTKMRLSNSFTSSQDLKFRVVGGNFINKNKITIQLYNQEYLLTLFVNNNKDIIKPIINKLKIIINALNKTKFISLIGSSVYIVYDSANTKNINVKLIDFAHSHILNEPHPSQQECIIGIKNIISVLKQIV